VRRGRNTIDKLTSMKLVNLVREEVSKRWTLKTLSHKRVEQVKKSDEEIGILIFLQVDEN